VRLVDDTATVLAGHREMWRNGNHVTQRPGEARVISLRPSDDRVFVAPEGGTLRPGRLRGWWNEALETAGIPHMCRNCGKAESCDHVAEEERPCKRCRCFDTVRRFHMTRHTAATLLLNSGVKVEVVSAILGHANIAITLDIYAKVRGDLIRKGFAKRQGAG
jgi:integrase